MAFKFLNLDNEIRKLMMSEIEFDTKNNNLYFSKNFSQYGFSEYPVLLKNSVENGTEESLGNSLKKPGMFNQEGTRATKKGVIAVKVPITAPITIAEGEYNRFYMRAVCLKAIAENKAVEIYRAKEVDNPRTESQMKIGKKMPPQSLLEDLRKNVGTDTALGLPPGPNSGLSIKIV